jgi:hypothetical protein
MSPKSIFPRARAGYVAPLLAAVLMAALGFTSGTALACSGFCQAAFQTGAAKGMKFPVNLHPGLTANTAHSNTVYANAVAQRAPHIKWAVWCAAARKC